jgi:hypothetical protein
MVLFELPILRDLLLSAVPLRVEANCQHCGNHAAADYAKQRFIHGSCPLIDEHRADCTIKEIPHKGE